MDTLGPANLGIILWSYGRCRLYEVKLYCHGPVGTTQLVLYREVKCIVSFTTMREAPLYYSKLLLINLRLHFILPDN